MYDPAPPGVEQHIRTMRTGTVVLVECRNTMLAVHKCGTGKPWRQHSDSKTENELAKIALAMLEHVKACGTKPEGPPGLTFMEVHQR